MSAPAKIRQFLLKYYDDNELTALCQGYFPAVRNEFTLGMTKSRKIQLLLDYCARENRYLELLERFEQERPTVYQREFGLPPADAVPASHELLIGVDRLSFDYHGRIQNFLDEYLGTPNDPEPFGGREAELDELDAWLANSDGAPYALIAAPAGRGKSALLVHWAERAKNRDLAHIVFVPVSIRFRTSQANIVFMALAARLGEVYQEPVAYAELSADQWHEICLSFLRRSPPDKKPVVVILDGLDEAADWQAGTNLLPGNPAEGVRAVVAARYLADDTDDRGWRGRLGWTSTGKAHSIQLNRLDEKGVCDVLAQMGDPLAQLSTQIDIVSELFRLTDGDPLLVHLYVKALVPSAQSAALIQPEDLASINPGLDGYFDGWWREQQRLWDLREEDPLVTQSDVQLFFNLCAGALGPLLREDVAEVVDEGGLTSGLRIRQVSQEVARFIIGDGVTRGYTFSHPRLGQYFWEQFTPREKRQLNEKFVAYGRRTLAALETDLLPLEELSAYPVQFYGAHLEQARAPLADFDRLISKPWLAAWEAVTGTHSGFLNDVNRAWRVAVQNSQPLVGKECRFALIAASLYSLATALPPNLLAALQQAGEWTAAQTLAFVRQSPEPRHQTEGLVRLAPHLPGELLAEALMAAFSLSDEALQAKAIIALAPYLDTALLQSTLERVQKMEQKQVRTQVLVAIGRILSPALQAEALQGIPDMSLEAQVKTLVAIAPHLSQTNLEDAWKLTQAVANDTYRVRAQAALLRHMPPAEQEIHLPETLALAENIHDPYWRTLSNSELVPFLPAKQVDEILQAIDGIESRATRAQLLTAVAPHLNTAQLPEALRLALELDEIYRVQAVEALAPSLNPEQLDAVINVAERITAGRSQVRLISVLIPFIAPERRVDLLNLALQTARELPGKYRRSEALASLAPHMHLLRQASRDVLQEALNDARTIEDVDDQTDCLAALAPYMPESLFNETLQLVQQKRGTMQRATLLSGLAPYVPLALLPDMRRAIERLRPVNRRVGSRMVRDYPSDMVWATLAPRLVALSRAEEALQIIRQMKNPSYQLQALSNCTPHWPNDFLLPVLDEIFRLLPALGLDDNNLRYEEDVNLFEDEKYGWGLKDDPFEIATGLLERLPEGEVDTQLERLLSLSLPQREIVDNIASWVVNLIKKGDEPRAFQVLDKVVMFFEQEADRDQFVYQVADMLEGRSEVVTTAVKIAQRLGDRDKMADFLLAFGNPNIRYSRPGAFFPFTEEKIAHLNRVPEVWQRVALAGGYAYYLPIEAIERFQEMLESDEIWPELRLKVASALLSYLVKFKGIEAVEYFVGQGNTAEIEHLETIAALSLEPDQIKPEVIETRPWSSLAAFGLAWQLTQTSQVASAQTLLASIPADNQSQLLLKLGEKAVFATSHNLPVAPVLYESYLTDTWDEEVLKEDEDVADRHVVATEERVASIVTGMVGVMDDEAISTVIDSITSTDIQNLVIETLAFRRAELNQLAAFKVALQTNSFANEDDLFSIIDSVSAYDLKQLLASIQDYVPPGPLRTRLITAVGWRLYVETRDLKSLVQLAQTEELMPDLHAQINEWADSISQNQPDSSVENGLAYEDEFEGETSESWNGEIETWPESENSFPYWSFEKQKKAVERIGASPDSETKALELLDFAWSLVGEESTSKRRLLRDVINELSAMSQPALEAVWRQMSESLRHETRPHLLFRIGKLTPLIVALGGEEATAETAEAVLEVIDWWP